MANCIALKWDHGLPWSLKYLYQYLNVHRMIAIDSDLSNDNTLDLILLMLCGTTITGMTRMNILAYSNHAAIQRCVCVSDFQQIVRGYTGHKYLHALFQCVWATNSPLIMFLYNLYSSYGLKIDLITLCILTLHPLFFSQKNRKKRFLNWIRYMFYLRSE